MKQILFTCTGNICRSPLAEYIFNQMAQRQALDWRAISAGSHAWPGDPISRHAGTLLKDEYGIDASAHEARSLREDDVRNSELVLTMTRAHAAALRLAFPEQRQKILPLHAFLQVNGQSEIRGALDVEDPYGGDYQVYQHCAAVLQDSLAKLADLLRLRD